MARRFKFCVNCRRTVTDAEIRRGLYVEGPQGILCATCARRLDEAPEAEEAPSPAAEAPPAKPERAAPPAPPVSQAGEKPEAAKKVESGDPALSHAGERHLENIREMVESIHRTLLFEKTSSWNIAGAVAQCLTVGMLLIAAMQWLDGEGAALAALLVAVVFQLMALTFFVKAK